MSFSITTAFVQQFTGNVRFLAQQQESRLAGAVMTDDIAGETAYMEQLAPTAARKVTTRHADSPLMNSQHLRRRITAYDYDWGDLIDKEDKARLLIDPASSYAMNAGFAMARSKDDEIIGCLWGNAYTGHSGNTVVAWPNGDNESSPAQPGGYVVAVNSWAFGNGSANAGLTVSKLIEAKVALGKAEGDENEERFIACSDQQIGNLLSTTEVTSADYNSVKALVEGKVDSFMGFTFIHTERNQVDANGYARVPAWRKSAIGLGTTIPLWTRVTERGDKRFSIYVFASQSIGATRLEEAKMVEIKCA
ncbi:MAG TPA: phage capsid protein [Aliidongia sp.]|uniref:phage capsid protein n=1 Tax=Aliidongia sp. TaxID=1914230 RepID=UPI002DDCE4D2|nr:phage capsid protein [Aliidongia sp.]HEV2673383.1 phage capsid protein [Aliidongia sp.]